MNFDYLSEQNIELFSIQHYDNPQCTGMDDFKEDLKKFKYIKRLFNSYFLNGGLKERLILNHMIMLFNVFENDALVRILFFKFDEKYYPLLKTFLIFLDRMPKIVHGVGNQHLISTNIKLDEVAVQKLREDA
jgi:hypothetical protein